MCAMGQYGLDVEYDTAATGNIGTREHTHSTYEVYFLVSGKRRYLMNDKIYDVSPGDVVFVPMEQLHRTTSVTKAGYHRYVAYFDAGQLALFEKIAGKAAVDRLLGCSCLQMPENGAAKLRREFEQLSKILENPTPLSRGLATHTLQGILLTILDSGVPKVPFDGESADKIQLVARYIAEHYSSEITLPFAAGLACMEETYFSRKFRHLTGFSFLEYLTQQRLLEARRLLRETDLSVGRIAEVCGFSGGNYFGDVFLRHYGKSPSAYRKECRR